MSNIQPTAEEVVAHALEAMFGKPLVTNVFRSMLVEAMIAKALTPTWKWCAADYSSWDFERSDGLRLEVKQAAARQTWTTVEGRPSKARFDIAHREGAWHGALWEPGRRRSAHIYVFAHHPVADPTADHREPGQWEFYVVCTLALPEAASISLAGISRLVRPVRLDGLLAAVGDAATLFASAQS
ncbi:MAG: hypothetical protein WDN45_03760 [Caulobacteraceae bacterium]